jgi:CHAD domain-containing protein
VAEAVAEAHSLVWRGKLATRLLRRAKAATAAVTEAGHIYAPEHLHSVRITVKKLRYAMELAADARVKGAAAHVRTLRRAQEALGRLHDLQILQAHVAAVQASPSRKTPPDHGLDLVARALEDECRHLHARYVAIIPALQELFQATRSVVVPQVTARRARRARPVKMGLAPVRRHPSTALAPTAGQRG